MTVHQDVEVGTELPSISIPLTFFNVAMTPFATWDFFPGHHNPDYARGQGQRDIYLNTIALQGFADRIITAWAGPDHFIQRRKMAMLGSAFSGDILQITGTVAEISSEPDGTQIVTLSIQLDTQNGRVCNVTTVIAVNDTQRSSISIA